MKRLEEVFSIHSAASDRKIQKAGGKDKKESFCVFCNNNHINFLTVLPIGAHYLKE